MCRPHLIALALVCAPLHTYSHPDHIPDLPTCADRAADHLSAQFANSFVNDPLDDLPDLIARCLHLHAKHTELSSPDSEDDRCLAVFPKKQLSRLRSSTPSHQRIRAILWRYLQCVSNAPFQAYTEPDTTSPSTASRSGDSTSTQTRLSFGSIASSSGRIYTPKPAPATMMCLPPIPGGDSPPCVRVVPFPNSFPTDELTLIIIVEETPYWPPISDDWTTRHLPDSYFDDPYPRLGEFYIQDVTSQFRPGIDLWQGRSEPLNQNG